MSKYVKVWGQMSICQDKGEVSNCLTLAGFFHFGISFHAFIRLPPQNSSYSSCRREGRAQNRRAEGGGNCQGGTQGAAVDGRFGRLMVVVCSVYLERWDRFCLITMFVCIQIYAFCTCGTPWRKNVIIFWYYKSMPWPIERGFHRFTVFLDCTLLHLSQSSLAPTSETYTNGDAAFRGWSQFLLDKTRQPGGRGRWLGWRTTTGLHCAVTGVINVV